MHFNRLCERCDDINFAKNKVCRKCRKTPRPPPGDKNVFGSIDGKEEKTNVQDVESREECVNDDIINVVMNRIRKQNKFRDWKCKSCKYINFESNDKCRKCGISKKENFGDWVCDSCNYSNFGFRIKCSKCNKDKPNNVIAKS